jgi:hypothetical protein
MKSRVGKMSDDHTSNRTSGIFEPVSTRKSSS